MEVFLDPLFETKLDLSIELVLSWLQEEDYTFIVNLNKWRSEKKRWCVPPFQKFWKFKKGGGPWKKICCGRN